MRPRANPQSRAARQVRAISRVTVPVSEARRAIDPLLRTSPGNPNRAAFVVALMIAAVLLHAFAVLVLYGVGFAARFGRPDPGTPPDSIIELAVVERPPPEPEPEGEPVPEALPPEEEAPEPPPPDPVDIPVAPPPPPPTAPPPRRVVGISFESTVQAGRGPTFAVGNTRMGRSEPNATVPETVEKLPKAPRPNRIARRIPRRGVNLVKPRKIGGRVRPEYPTDLKAQNLEANVVVEVTIGVDGRVRRVEVIAPSPHTAFNESAVEAAKKQRWSPAEQRGQPIEFTVTYTVRFRLKD